MVAVGETPPDFNLKNQNGDVISLGSFKEEEKSVVVRDNVGAGCRMS